LGFSVSGKVAPETVKPAPLIASALTLTAAAPVELSVTVCVAAVFTGSLPNVKVVALTVSVGTVAPSCSAKVFDTLFALAVSVTVVAVLTAVAVAVNVALLDPAATVTDAGMVTAVLLLARLTASPPVAAAAFNETVQLSVPAPVIDPLVQVSPVNTGTPVPVSVTAVEVPVEELLVSVSDPVTAPAVVGSNCTVSVAV
jgi:hypothetical protein